MDITSSNGAATRRKPTSRSSPVAVSVPEGRMKADELKRTTQSVGIPVKRKILRSESSELGKNCDDAVKKSPVQSKKTRSESGGDRSPLQLKKTRSELHELRKSKSVSDTELSNSKPKLDSPDQETGDGSGGGTENAVADSESGGAMVPYSARSEDSDECEEKMITGNLDSVDHEDQEEEEEMDEEIEVEEVFDVKEMNDVKKLNQLHQIPNPISSIAAKQLKTQIPVYDECQRQSIPETHTKLQNLVDLVMWRDASKSAFVFGVGTFIITSSSYTNDLNISPISVFGYLGLVYLAMIFLYRSFRGAIDVDDSTQNYFLGEEEAIWLVRLVLPYVNVFLFKIKDLFSGDPAMTMKLAVVLFVLARCGSSITVWKMVKLGFFGVFTLPKICSSYSAHITAYGMFWIRRFRDAWESCSHKKAVAFAIFALFWNLSSVVARIWAAFMLFAAFRCYQQSIVREECSEGESAAVDDLRQTQVERRRGGVRGGSRPASGVHIHKQKKGS